MRIKMIPISCVGYNEEIREGLVPLDDDGFIGNKVHCPNCASIIGNLSIDFTLIQEMKNCDYETLEEILTLKSKDAGRHWPPMEISEKDTYAIVKKRESNWAYSFEEEGMCYHGGFETKEDAIKEARSLVDPGTKIWVGREKWPKASDYFNDDWLADWLVNHIEELASDDICLDYDDNIFHIKNIGEMVSEIKEILDKHMVPEIYYVEDSYPITDEHPLPRAGDEDE